MYTVLVSLFFWFHVIYTCIIICAVFLSSLGVPPPQDICEHGEPMECETGNSTVDISNSLYEEFFFFFFFIIICRTYDRRTCT